MLDTDTSTGHYVYISGNSTLQSAQVCVESFPRNISQNQIAITEGERGNANLYTGTSRFCCLRASFK